MVEKSWKKQSANKMLSPMKIVNFLSFRGEVFSNACCVNTV